MVQEEGGLEPRGLGARLERLHREHGGHDRVPAAGVHQLRDHRPVILLQAAAMGFQRLEDRMNLSVIFLPYFHIHVFPHNCRQLLNHIYCKMKSAVNN